MQNEIQKRTNRLKINLFISVVIVAVAFFGITYQTDFVIYFTALVLAGLSSFFLLSIKKDGLGAFLASFLGCVVLIIVIIYPTDIPITEETLDPKAFSTGTVSLKISYLEHSRAILKENGIYVGIFNIAIGLMLAYRPNMIYVKNRLAFAYPYPIWDSKKNLIVKFSTPMIKIKSLLTENKKWIIFKYRFILVQIDNKIYLAKPKDHVPEDAILLRSKSGNSILGVG